MESEKGLEADQKAYSERVYTFDACACACTCTLAFAPIIRRRVLQSESHERQDRGNRAPSFIGFFGTPSWIR